MQLNRIFVYNFGEEMTDEENKLLTTFETKLRHFIYLQETLQEENHRLRQMLDEKEEEIKGMRAENNQLQRQYADLKSAMTISLNGSDVKETKLRLSKLVREVDRCIALLNT